ncbi:hypothetical protein NFG57_15020 [Halomonas sp. H10-59]|uniref:CASP-like protein n=1 Tax=Halomonas sp. H10-59 TaxID=2950874 RepID=A0AAU7KQT5_9GAMM|nr:MULTISPECIES: hypothetical protein [unclassified Halomonas]MBY6109936.1 hypothetical protein [Halomonas sp. DP1Y21-3]|tara:strand:- start:79 stop:537 length:459 start_codon:yes stop_codon:yes gene_type:complete
MAWPMCEQSDVRRAGCEEYRELLASLRHYGNIRFAMLALFSTATAAIIGLNRGDASPTAGDASLSTLLYELIPIVASWVFLRLNVQLSEYINALGDQVAHYPHCHLNKIEGFRSRKVSSLFYTLYASVLGFWMLKALLFLFEVKGLSSALVP